nr:MAG TPA: repressor domain protein [Caudoviricetes sp.]
MENENKIQIFENSEFGKVRTLMIDGEPWAAAIDVAKSLGYAKPADAIRKHVDEMDKGVSKMETPGGVQDTVIINESGLYSLILSSKLPKAKEFKRWITSEVLPALRKTGHYGSPHTLADLVPLIESLRKIMKSQRSHPVEIAEMAKTLCEQNGIRLPESFICNRYFPTAPLGQSQRDKLDYIFDLTHMDRFQFEAKYKVKE